MRLRREEVAEDNMKIKACCGGDVDDQRQP